MGGRIIITCGQFLFDTIDNQRDYTGDEGIKRAIYDCCTEKQAKAKYAYSVAKKITEIEDISQRIPPKIKQLLIAMQPLVVTSEGDDESESIRETASDS